MPTIGDKTFAELGLKVRESYQHPGPSTRDYTMAIPGRAGAWDFGADLDTIPFDLPCKLWQQSDVARDKAIRAVMAHLFDPSGKPRTLPLSFESSPEIFYNVRYSGRMPIRRIIGLGDFVLPLTAFSGFGYADSTSYDPSPVPQYDTGVQYDSGLMYPNPTSFDWLYSRQYVGLYNYAFLNTPVRIIIKGPVINPRITNQTTGQMMTVNVATAVNDSLVIESNNFTVTNNASNLLSKQYGEFLQIAPGSNSLKFEGGLPNASVQIIWDHRYL